MGTIFNPSRNAIVNAKRGLHGYVARVAELPTANAKVEGYVVFCGEDKRFYECQHITTDTEDYYRWVAVTSGGQRTFFIPVERLTEDEEHAIPRDDVRTNCFDAIASAISELALGLYRYGILIEPLCYKTCTDKVYLAGKKYYVWYDSFDRAEYIRTTDTTAVAGKIYYYIDTKGDYIHYAPDAGTSLTDKTYYESTRPLFIEDPAYVAGGAIDHRVFVSNGILFKELQMTHLAAKLNEIVDAINVTNTKLSKVQDIDHCTLFQLATVVNAVVDEVNPFSNAWNNLLKRVTTLEKEVKRGSLVYPFDLPQYIKKDGITYKCDIEIVGGEVKGVITPVS